MPGERNLKGLPPAYSALGGGVGGGGGKSETVSEQIGCGQIIHNDEGRIPKHHRLPVENRGGEESESEANKSRHCDDIGVGQIMKDTRHKRTKTEPTQQVSSEPGACPRKMGNVWGRIRCERG